MVITIYGSSFYFYKDSRKHSDSTDYFFIGSSGRTIVYRECHEE